MTIARQLGLEPTTVGNFFMNARRRSHDKWREGPDDMDMDDEDLDCSNENIKYEVYECQENGMDNGGYGQEYGDNGLNSGLVGIAEPQGQTVYGHPGSMTVVPGPVHHNHNQIQFPPTCT